MNQFNQLNGFFSYGPSVVENAFLKTEPQAETSANLTSCALFWKKFKVVCKSTYTTVSYFLYDTFRPTIHKYITCYCAIRSTTRPMLQRDNQVIF